MQSTFLQNNYGGDRPFPSCVNFCGGPSDPFSNGSHRPQQGDIERDEMKQTEAFLAAEMNRLTVQERSQALDDVHCVGVELKETPEMVQQSLAQFESIIPQEKNAFYELACQQNRSYVEDPSFRLKFLRANMHDVGRSVRQMMTFLRCKAIYFGINKLAWDITLNDLNQEDLDMLSSGLFHIQESKDQSGRVVLWIFNNMLGQGSVETMNRVSYYVIFNIVSSIPAVQYKGLVTCYYDMAKPGEEFAIPSMDYMVKTLEMNVSFPVRFSAMHHGLKTGKGNLVLNNLLISAAMKFFPKDGRVRARLHYGSDMELHYQLQQHGFDLNTCPVDSTGNIRKDIINKWLDKHKSIEESTTAGDLPKLSDPLVMDEDCSGNFTGFFSGEGEKPSAVLRREEHIQPTATVPASVAPRQNDILLGRGRTIQNHLGNVNFREFLKQYKDDYNEAPRSKRRKIASDLVNTLKANGVRFLQQTESGEWIESHNMAEVEKKVGQVFRNTRRR